jgi:hypothetical protein
MFSYGMSRPSSSSITRLSNSPSATCVIKLQLSYTSKIFQDEKCLRWEKETHKLLSTVSIMSWLREERPCQLMVPSFNPLPLICNLCKFVREPTSRGSSSRLLPPRSNTRTDNPMDHTAAGTFYPPLQATIPKRNNARQFPCFHPSFVKG